MSNEEGNEVVELDPSLFAEETPDQEPEQALDQQPEETDQEPEEDIPEKYRGKTAAEIIRMHQDAERLIGRQGSEVGELRAIVNDMLAAAQPSPAPQEPEVDFYEDPKGAVSKAVADTLNNDPRLKKLDEMSAREERNAKAQQLAAEHPDYMEVVNTPEFVNWVQKSKVRAKAFQESHANFDVETASDILTDYKDHIGTIKATTKAAKANRATAVKQASTGSGKASAETRGKPTLSSEALIELKIKNPDKYYAMMPQIKQAYMDGRVK